MLKMADDYYSDAKYFADQGDYVRAFGAINYAHAWIDAGVKIGLLDGHGDDVLFTLPEICSASDLSLPFVLTCHQFFVAQSKQYVNSSVMTLIVNTRMMVFLYPYS